MRAAIYARYSSDNQREESITAQFRSCEQYCQKKGYTIVKHYKDEAKSGTSDKRSEFQQMLRDAKAGLFDRLIVHKVDRFARKRLHAQLYKYELELAGVHIEYSEYNLDTSTDESVILEGMLETYAEYFSRNLAREVMKGMKENAYQSKFNGGVPPFGYDIVDGKYVINEYEATGVRLIFSMYLQDKGYKDIIKALQQAGYRTRQGNTFAKNSLHSILTNEKYAGIYKFDKVKKKANGTRNSHSLNKDAITVPGGVPEIIDMKTFEAAMKKMEHNKKRPGAYLAKHDYLLSGYITCGECGSAMVGKASKVRDIYYYRYYCGSRERKVGSCDNPTVRLLELEEFVLHQIEQRLLNINIMPELIDEISNAYQQKGSILTIELKHLEQQKTDLTRKIDNLINFIENGNDDELILKRLSENKKNFAEINHKITAIKSKINTKMLTKEQVEQLFNHYQVLLKQKDLESIQVLINTFLDRVTVYKDYVDVSLRISVGVLGAGEGT